MQEEKNFRCEWSLKDYWFLYSDKLLGQKKELNPRYIVVARKGFFIFSQCASGYVKNLEVKHIFLEHMKRHCDQLLAILKDAGKIFKLSIFLLI